MKNFLFLIAMIGAVTFSGVLTTTVSDASGGVTKKERAVMKFNQPVQLMGETLKGEYLFVHDDEAMARGEACTYVYKGNAENANNLAVWFHCIPANRTKAATFVVRTVMTLPGRNEIREYQFAGSTEAHVVPLTQHTEHLPTER